MRSIGSVFNKKIFLVITALAGAILVFTFSTDHGQVDFNTQVKPIFNNKCISCHGGVKRKAGFSLLFRSEALANTESGKPAIIPGKPDQSELIRRITLNDPEERMPYKHEPLSQKEIETLRQWIKQGAAWGNHWAYVPVANTEIPESDWEAAKNGIDHFIADKLQAEKITPSPEADKASLLRRVSLDITGLPPTKQMASAFLNNSQPDAYAKLVDTLLASAAYGERWASLWLDLARYADTKGYERDDSRNIWRYRDWLIKAFNEDKPYNQFLTEQIAGDLLPAATDDQLIATAFHRNTMTNDEGGTDNEEFRTAAVMDRVNTTWEVLMGTSFACVQCHSHPYDPFKHEEYYKFAAFFNNTRDEDTFEEYPLLRHFPDSLQEKLGSLKSWLEKNATPEKAANTLSFLKTWEPSIHSLTADQFVNSELADTKWLVFRNNGSARLKKVNLENSDRLFIRYRTGLENGIWKIHLDRPDGQVLKTIVLQSDKRWKWNIEEIEIPIVKGVHDLYLSYSNRNLKKPEDNGVQFDWFHFTGAFPESDKAESKKYKKIFAELLEANLSTTPIMMENPADMFRETKVFERGNWLVKGTKVSPETPHSLNAFPAKAPMNRLGLAKWITDPKNPLTARTMVNRLWEQMFGTGLVETLEDMGTQGATPTHKELLDWMSYRFMNDFNWSIKKMIREIVMSATYRQSSKADPELTSNDPYNKLYARGPAVRLNAEQVRDQALSLSGLLDQEMFGPSVMPVQPEGIWQSPYNGLKWQTNTADKYRRAVYTFWKRTAPYPAMLTFDGAMREVCTSRRIRTNTPLQALVTLNDEAYLDMARAFAYRMKKEGGKDVKSQISKGYELALYKPISAPKLTAFEKLYEQALLKFKQDKDKTCEMIGFINEHNNPETAALVVVANAMLNLDEMITKN